MAKKYSVQVENDEVVSVEVDGITYASPDDIPDEKDREKIKNLVSRTMAADSADDSGEAFDKEYKEYQKEFDTLDRQPTVIPKVLLGIFLSIAAIMAVIMAISAYSAAKTVSREKSTPGQVVALVVRRSQDTSTGEVTDFSYPVVEYAVPDSRPMRVQMPDGSSPPDYTVGDPVTVLYDPQKPDNSRIKSFSSDLLLWILPLITFLVGAGFTTAAVVVYKISWPKRKKTGSA